MRDVRIGNRLIAGYAIAIVIITFLCLNCFKNMRDTDAMLSQILNIDFEKVTLANTIHTSLQIIDRTVVGKGKMGSKLC